MNPGRLGCTYAVTISGVETAKVFTSKSLDGPWSSLGEVKVNPGPNSSTFNTEGNFRTILGPDGKYHAIVNGFQTAISDAVDGPYTVQNAPLFASIPGSPTDNMEDPLIWYSGGKYHVIFNSWPTKKAYHYTSSDGATGWKLEPGVAYDAGVNFTTYTDGTVNHWAKLERPSMYIENGVPTAMTFAAIDVEKDQDLGNDQHGSKVIVLPFDGAALNNPDPNLPTVASDVNQGGSKAALGLGRYTLAQLQAKGIVDNSISSIALSQGYRVTGYDGDNFAGTSWTFGATNNDLRASGNNDRISSLVVSLDPSAQFEVSNERSSRALDVSGGSTSDGASVLQWEYTASPNQQWRFVDAGNGYSKIVNRKSGKLLDVTGGSTADGTQLTQSSDTGAASQQWQLASLSNGGLTITNRASGKVVDVAGGSMDNGGSVIQWPGSNSSNQHWKIVKVG